MKATYKAWIEKHVPSYDEAYGHCTMITEVMAKAFPELNRVRGHYYCHAWGERAHWWLVAPDGSVVDPTAKQFPSAGKGAYVPWLEGDKEPTGSCLECGQAAYDARSFCSDNCEREFVGGLML